MVEWIRLAQEFLHVLQVNLCVRSCQKICYGEGLCRWNLGRFSKFIRLSVRKCGIEFLKAQTHILAKSLPFQSEYCKVVCCVRAEQHKIPNFDSIHAHALRQLCKGHDVSFVLFIRSPNFFFINLFSDSHSVRCPTTFHIVLRVNHCFYRLSGFHVDSVSITTFVSFACTRANVYWCIHLLLLVSTGNASCCMIYMFVI